jgi:hypothetical protein
MRKPLIWRVLGIALLVLLPSSSSRVGADVVSLDSVTSFDYSHYLGVTVSFTSPHVSFTEGTLAGSFKTYLNNDAYNKSIHPLPSWAKLGTGATFTTYCIDLSTYLANGVTRTGQDGTSLASSVTDANGIARNIGAAGWVMDNFADLKAISKKFTASLSEEIAAVQLSIWIAGYDPSVVKTLNPIYDQKHKVITGYTTQHDSTKTYLSFSGQAVQDAKVVSIVDWILGQRTKNSIDPVGFINYPGIKPPGKGWQTDDQDELFAIHVPEPSTLVISMVAGILFLGYARLHRRNVRA